MNAFIKVRTLFVLAALIAGTLFLPTGAGAHHADAAAWDQGYPLAVSCGEGQAIYLQWRIVTGDKTKHEDADDRRVHTFLKGAANPRAHHVPEVHYDVPPENIVRVADLPNGGAAFTYRAVYPGAFGRFRTAWPKPDTVDPETGQTQLLSVSCIHADGKLAARYAVEHNPKRPVH